MEEVANADAGQRQECDRHDGDHTGRRPPPVRSPPSGIRVCGSGAVSIHYWRPRSWKPSCPAGQGKQADEVRGTGGTRSRLRQVSPWGIPTGQICIIARTRGGSRAVQRGPGGGDRMQNVPEVGCKGRMGRSARPRKGHITIEVAGKVAPRVWGRESRRWRGSEHGADSRDAVGRRLWRLCDVAGPADRVLEPGGRGESSDTPRTRLWAVTATRW